MADAPYRGRFAPSPTGPLHFGSLVAALASYLEARTHEDGEWRLRIDDLDQTRCVPGMDTRIVLTLEAFGFEWDGPIAWQSQTTDAYQAALDELDRQGRVYHCQCSRKQIASMAKHSGSDGPVYPGTCRRSGLAGGEGRATRILVDDETIRFGDELYGQQSQNLAWDVGDFVIHRADGHFAYQLAVVVDDHLQQITHVVRGADLLPSTPRQTWLQRLLGFSTPHYLHVPLVLDRHGRKLSKRDAAHPVDADDPLPSLRAAWNFLGQAMPESDDLTLTEFWQWAPTVWQSKRMKPETHHD